MYPVFEYLPKKWKFILVFSFVFYVIFSTFLLLGEEYCKYEFAKLQVGFEAKHSKCFPKEIIKKHLDNVYPYVSETNFEKYKNKIETRNKIYCHE